MREEFEPAATPQGFDRAKIAKVIDYEVPANWKLVWENNRECYHCVRCHPQYIKAEIRPVQRGICLRAGQEKIAAARPARGEVGVAGT